MIHVGFTTFGLTIIEAECDPENVASVGVMERVGLINKGELYREDRGGKLIKRLHYELNAQEYKEKAWAELEIEDPY